jgi:hypothetical protein
MKDVIGTEVRLGAVSYDLRVRRGDGVPVTKGRTRMSDVSASPTWARFPIRFDRWYEALSRALFIAPSDSYVAIDGGRMTVRMAWGFEASFPCAAVAAVAPYDRRPVSRGVHGWRGRWLVNGSGDGIVRIELSPGQRARVLGVPVELRELLVSVDDPARLASALAKV